MRSPVTQKAFGHLMFSYSISITTITYDQAPALKRVVRIYA